MLKLKICTWQKMILIFAVVIILLLSFNQSGFITLSSNNKGYQNAEVITSTTKIPTLSTNQPSDMAICGNQPESFYLKFPLLNRNAYNALINSVFDHSMSNSYSADNKVITYTGEIGDLQYGRLIGNAAFSLYGFKNRDGINFIVNGNYSGAGSPNYLFYDGHPGFDYRTTDQAPNGQINVYATANGTAYRGDSNYGVVSIDHGNGYVSQYLHLSQRIANNTTVTAGQWIGVSGEVGAPGAPHLHFEVLKNGVFVDPYGWQGQYADPRTTASTNLWKPRAYASCDVRWHPDGTLITVDGSTVYLIEGGKKRGIPSLSVFQAYGFDFANMINVSQGEFDCIQTSSALGLPTSPRLRNAGGTIYEITDQNKKRGFASAKILVGQGFRWDDVQSASVSGIADDPNIPVYNSPFREGTLLMASGTPVYIISNSRKMPFASSTAFTKLGYRFDNVISTTQTELNAIPTSSTTITESLIAQCGNSTPTPTPTVTPTITPTPTPTVTPTITPTPTPTVTPTPTLSNRVSFDFDGDRKADVSVFRPSDGIWHIANSLSGYSAYRFGFSSDKIVPADYDGDGKTDYAVFRPSNGVWYVQRSSLGFIGYQFGFGTDIPMPADYDGDGKADVAVYRPSNGRWYLLRSNLGYVEFQFGVNEDKPVSADYDGDGKADIAVYRPSNGYWYISQTAQGYKTVQFGISEDRQVPADYDGDGKADIAVFRPSTGTWYLYRSSLGYTGFGFGLSSDQPVPADYDGDGKDDIAIYRPGDGYWHIQRSNLGFTAYRFGISTDMPLPLAYVR